jgi:phage recombination protein Bet
VKGCDSGHSVSEDVVGSKQKDVPAADAPPVDLLDATGVVMPDAVDVPADQALTAITEKGLSDNWKKRGATIEQVRTLFNAYQGARPESVMLVWDYCRARGLDPLKKPVHIVPMYVKSAITGNGSMRDVIMPGIYEYRTTAHRTGLYMGHTRPVYGDMRTFHSKNAKLKGEALQKSAVEAPEFCEMTVYRWNAAAGQRTEFPVITYFSEAVARTRDGDINDRWTTAPIQMLTKCCEAAALREAFPEEFGGTHTMEEMAGRHFNDIETTAVQTQPDETPKAPAGFEPWLEELRTAAQLSPAKLTAIFAAATREFRDYLTRHHYGEWESLKAQSMSTGSELPA